MAKINVYMLPMPEHKSESRTLAIREGVELTLRLKVPTPQDEFAAVDVTRELIDKYCENEDGEVKIAMAPVSGEAVLPTPSACSFAAQVFVLQDAEDGEDSYRADEILIMLMSPITNEWLNQFVADAYKGFKKKDQDLPGRTDTVKPDLP